VEAKPSAPVTLTIKPTNPGSKTTNQLDYAVELMNSRRNEDAEALLRGLLGGTHDYSARKHLLALYSRVNRPNRLRSLLQASLLEYPQDPLFETEYARSLFAAAAYHEVIELFAQRTTLNTDQQALLAASYQRLDQHEAAIRHYQFALQRDAKNARNWVGLGISQEQRAAFIDALASYQQASELGSLNARLQAFVTRRIAQLRQVLN
jgi:tetratricopeptide (TPR) repeat protein